jgi:hypothetical protein
MNRVSTKVLATAALVAFAGLSSTAPAQSTMQSVTPANGAFGGGSGDLFHGAPGTNLSAPMAFGPALGEFFVGGFYVNRLRTIKVNGAWLPDNLADDGSISAGFGFGDANDIVGLSTVITAPSYRAGFGNNTSVSFALFHNFGANTAFAIGVENAIVSGGDRGGASWYGVASHVYPAPFKTVEWLKSLTVSLGVGDGRFRLADDIAKDRKTVMAFGTVGAQVHEKVSILLDYSGQDADVGLSIAPFKGVPLAITPMIVDLAGFGNKGPRPVVGAGWGFRF